MRAAVLGAVFAFACAACAGHVPVECSLDQFVIADPTTQDCGTFARGDANYTDEAMIAAQLCVLNAVVHQRAFRLVYDADNAASGDPEPGLRAAFVGTVQGDVLHVSAYAGHHAADMSSSDDRVSAQPCDTLIASPSCKPVVGVSCLQCGSTAPGTIVCRG